MARSPASLEEAWCDGGALLCTWLIDSGFWSPCWLVRLCSVPMPGVRAVVEGELGGCRWRIWRHHECPWRMWRSSGRCGPSWDKALWSLQGRAPVCDSWDWCCCKEGKGLE